MLGNRVLDCTILGLNGFINTNCWILILVLYFEVVTGILYEKGTLTPNSMVYGNHSIYIGMYGGVYEYDLDTGSEKWYDYLPEGISGKE